MTILNIDLNCDMGEGCANDRELMNHVSSISVACGYHAGDRSTMQRTVETAIAKGVAIGAHPSFPDREGFGRRSMAVPANEISDIVAAQIELLREICHAAGTRLDHVKPHGALYNLAARDLETAMAIARAVSSVDKGLVVFGLSGSMSIRAAAECGLATASEVFADRTYAPNGSLTRRSKPGALISETASAVDHVLQMIRNQSVTATDGTCVPIVADTVCIHGDGENAVEFARSIVASLRENGIAIVRTAGSKSL